MRYEIRARSIGEVMDGALQIYRDNLGLYLTLSALLNVPAYAVQLLALYSAGAPFDDKVRAGKAAMTTLPVTMPALLLAHVMCSLLLTVAIAARFRGESCDVGTAFRRALPLFWTALASDFVLGLGTWGGLILLIVPGLIFGLNRLLNLQAIVVEGKGPVDALRRSKALCKGDRGRAQWPWFFMTLLVSAISFGFDAVVPSSVPWLIKQLLAAVPPIVLAPLVPAVLTLSYFDARVRQEGYDLKVMTEETLGAPKVAGAELGR
jgi:hypothetical protein